MADKRTEVTIAHASFWFIDEEGRNRIALRGATIEVGADDYARGERFDAFAMDVPESDAPIVVAVPVAPADEPASDKIDDIKAWVDSDPARAQEALTKELEKDEDDRRSTLVDFLQGLVGGAS